MTTTATHCHCGAKFWENNRCIVCGTPGLFEIRPSDLLREHAIGHCACDPTHPVRVPAMSKDEVEAHFIAQIDTVERIDDTIRALALMPGTRWDDPKITLLLARRDALTGEVY